jgi:hypothetical protein
MSDRQVAVGVVEDCEAIDQPESAHLEPATVEESDLRRRLAGGEPGVGYALLDEPEPTCLPGWFGHDEGLSSSGV